MPAPRIRGDYDALARAAKAFSKQAHSNQQMLNKLKRQVGVLQGGDWIGKGAKAFYAEMESQVIPSLTRLVAAMEAAARSTQKISKIIHQAEQDSAKLFKLEVGGGLLGGMVGAAIADAVGAAVGAGGQGGASSAQQANPLLAVDPSTLFGDSYMQGLVGSQFQGAGSELGSIMIQLNQNPSGDQLNGLLIKLSDLRGRPLAEIQIEFQKFQEAKAQQAANNPTPDVAPPAAGGGGGGGQASFNGSNSQMRFGKVVGDALGIDPALGAMLHPGGGLVGPGNFAVAADNTAVGYHATLHEAAGYLHTYHNAGPGYDYLGGGGAGSNPLSGQHASIAYWRQATGGSSPANAAGQWMMGDFVGTWDAASKATDAVGGVF